MHGNNSEDSLNFCSLRKNWLPALLLPFWLVTAAWAEPAQALDKSQPPNIVFILVDDLAWSDLGCYDHPYHRTPHIDGLAEDGLRFLAGYAPAPICSASRASILTGKAVPRLGFEFVTKAQPGHQQLDTQVPLAAPAYTLNLPLEESTIAERLQQLGYQTAFAGKWHVNQHYRGKYLAWDPRYGPAQQGFNIGIEDFGNHPYAWRKQKVPAATAPHEFPADSLIDSAAEFIRSSDAERPYFLMVSTYYVHTPVKSRCRWLVEHYTGVLPREASNRTQRLEYAAFVETLDHYVGSLIEAVDASPQAENTLIFFMSDNGGHPEYAANGPLRGSKWNLYEGGIRVPMLARWPANIAAGQTCTVPVIGYDLLPTFVALAGGPEYPSASPVDGISLTRLLEKPQTPLEPRELIWHFPYYHPETTYSKAIDQIGVNDFATSKTRPQSALRAGRYKLLKFAEDERLELYDLATDPSEQHDLSKSHRELASQMERSLEERLEAMQARRARPR